MVLRGTESSLNSNLGHSPMTSHSEYASSAVVVVAAENVAWYFFIQAL